VIPNDATPGEISGAVDREQGGIGIHVDIEGIGGEVAGHDVIHGLAEVEGVEQEVQHQDPPFAIGRESRGVGLNQLDRSIWQLHVHERWDRERDAVDDRWPAQDRMPVLGHALEEFRALNGVAKLDVCPEV